ncbi:MAG: hypothetical protein Q9195_000457 [Heterodermia aff. obscurata]
MLKDNSDQDGRGADVIDGAHCDIIDIRDHTEVNSLPQTLRHSLKGGSSGDDEPTFPSLLLWDRQGLRLFEKVTYCEEYYLTRSEIEVLEANSGKIAERIAPNSMVVEMGSGNLRKIKILLQALDNLGPSFDYYALDLSEPELWRSLDQVTPGTFKHVECHGLLGTFDDGQRWLQRAENVHRPKCVVSLGSTIGSFSRNNAANFLCDLGRSLNCKASGLEAGHAEASSLLVGLDGCTDAQRVFLAYNDPDGLNTAFILNALDHANVVLGYIAFDRSAWTVRGEWNNAKGSHDQYLVPQKDVEFEGAILKASSKIAIVSSMKYDFKQKNQLWEGAKCMEIGRWSNQDGSYGK